MDRSEVGGIARSEMEAPKQGNCFVSFVRASGRGEAARAGEGSCCRSRRGKVRPNVSVARPAVAQLLKFSPLNVDNR